MSDEISVLERLTKLEVLMENHLASHIHILRWVLCPILVGVILTTIRVYLFK